MAEEDLIANELETTVDDNIIENRNRLIKVVGSIGDGILISLSKLCNLFQLSKHIICLHLHRFSLSELAESPIDTESECPACPFTVIVLHKIVIANCAPLCSP